LERQARIKELRHMVEHSRVDAGHSFFVERGLEFRDRPSFIGLLRRPDIRLQDLISAGVLHVRGCRREDIVSLDTAIKYEGYLRQQDREVEKLRKAESKRIPEDMDYTMMPGLSREIVEKLTKVRPKSIAQASRIPGITPAAISILLLHLEMRSRMQRENVV
jgi:tRNA uridine 5-carboxymethylaminomethyl modification enzyme